MLDVTVKTLDGKNRSFSVPDDITVKQFKEKIAASIEIPEDSQRLIFQGRVLQDEKILNEYDVNGKTLHVVVRAPPSVRGTEASTSSSATSSPGPTRRGAPGSQPGGGNTVLMTSFTIPAEPTDPNQVQNLVQNVLSGLGDVGRNARVTTRSTGDGSSMDVHINLGNVGPPQLVSESQNRLNQAQRMIRMANRTVDALENPPGAGSPADDNPSMDTGSPDSSTPTTEGADSSPTERLTPDGARSSPPEAGSSAGTPTEGQPRRSRHPQASVMADVLQQLADLNERLAPHLNRYQTLMREDPSLPDQESETRSRQRLCAMVTEVMHFISHAYHHCSDIMIDMGQAPPRCLRASAAPMNHANAVIQQSIPVQINVAHGTGSPRLARRNPATTTASSSSSSASSSSSSSSSSSTGAARASNTAPAETQTNTRPTSTAPPMGTPGGIPAGFPAGFPGFPPGGIPGFPPGAFPGFPMGGEMPGFPPPGMMSGNGTPGSPYMFVGMGPNGSVSMNSVSAEIITEDGSVPMPNAPPTSSPNAAPTSSTASTTSTNTSAPGGGTTPSGGVPPQAFLPPGFLQNILQNAMMRAPHMVVVGRGATSSAATPGTTATPQAPTPTSTATASTANASTANASTANASTAATSTTAQTSTSSSANGGVPPPRPGATFVIPGSPHGGLPLGMHPPVDPYLPCSSRHFLVQAARQAAQARATATSASAASTASSSTTSASPGQAEQGLASMVGQIVQSLLGGGQGGMTTTTASGQTGPVPTPRPASSTTNSTTTGANQPPGPAPSTPNLGGLFSMMQGMQGQRDAVPPPADDVYNNLVRAISQSMTPGQGQGPGTVADMMTQFGLSSEEETDGMLAEVLMLLSRHLTFPDLMMIFFGAPGPLGRVREPLQNYIRENVMRGEEATSENVERGVERLLTSVQTQVEAMCADVTAVDDIDFKATTNEFLTQHLTATIRLVLNATATDTAFPQNLYHRVRRIIHEYLVLCNTSLQGGMDTTERLLQNRIRHMTSTETSPEMQQWMLATTSQQLRQLLPTITVTASQVQCYIKRQSNTTQTASSPSSDASYMSAESGTDSTEAVTMETASDLAKEVAKAEESMDVDQDEVKPVSSQPRPRVRQAPELDATLLSRLPPPPRRDDLDTDYDASGIGSTDWQRAVPAEWVPVIARDIRRQQREPPQPPFSDAYINGMSSKRRKLMGNHEVEHQLHDVSSLLPRTITHAAESLGVQPTTSLEQVAKEASQDETLKDAFQSEIKKSISKRVRKDSDYVPEKYPNSDKFYKE